MHDAALYNVLILPWGHVEHQDPPFHPPRTYLPGRHAIVGATVGALVGVAVVGALLGRAVGALVGMEVGVVVGASVGALVGDFVGTAVGILLGVSVGAAVVGGRVGAGVGIVMHSDAPVTASAVHEPAGQSRHRSYTPASWYLPDGQCEQKAAPVLATNLPTAQSLHDWPADKWNRPTAQAVHVVAGATAKLPLGQASQAPAL
jgi:hypothetical protein